MLWLLASPLALFGLVAWFTSLIVIVLRYGKRLRIGGKQTLPVTAPPVEATTTPTPPTTQARPSIRKPSWSQRLSTSFVTRIFTRVRWPWKRMRYQRIELLPVVGSPLVRSLPTSKSTESQYTKPKIPSKLSLEEEDDIPEKMEQGETPPLVDLGTSTESFAPFSASSNVTVDPTTPGSSPAQPPQTPPRSATLPAFPSPPPIDPFSPVSSPFPLRTKGKEREIIGIHAYGQPLVQYSPLPSRTASPAVSQPNFYSPTRSASTGSSRLVYPHSRPRTPSPTLNPYFLATSSPSPTQNPRPRTKSLGKRVSFAPVESFGPPLDLRSRSDETFCPGRVREYDDYGDVTAGAATTNIASSSSSSSDSVQQLEEAFVLVDLGRTAARSRTPGVPAATAVTVLPLPCDLPSPLSLVDSADGLAHADVFGGPDVRRSEAGLVDFSPLGSPVFIKPERLWDEPLWGEEEEVERDYQMQVTAGEEAPAVGHLEEEDKSPVGGVVVQDYESGREEEEAEVADVDMAGLVEGLVPSEVADTSEEIIAAKTEAEATLPEAVETQPVVLAEEEQDSDVDVKEQRESDKPEIEELKKEQQDVDFFDQPFSDPGDSESGEDSSGHSNNVSDDEEELVGLSDDELGTALPPLTTAQLPTPEFDTHPTSGFTEPDLPDLTHLHVLDFLPSRSPSPADSKRSILTPVSQIPTPPDSPPMSTWLSVNRRLEKDRARSVSPAISRAASVVSLAVDDDVHDPEVPSLPGLALELKGEACTSPESTLPSILAVDDASDPELPSLPDVREKEEPYTSTMSSSPSIVAVDDAPDPELPSLEEYAPHEEEEDENDVFEDAEAAPTHVEETTIVPAQLEELAVVSPTAVPDDLEDDDEDEVFEDAETEPRALPAWSVRAAEAPRLGLGNSSKSNAIEKKAEFSKEERPTILFTDSPSELTIRKRTKSTPAGLAPPTPSTSPLTGPTLSTSSLAVPTPAHTRARALSFSVAAAVASITPRITELRRKRPSPVDVALAMQMRPGLGIGADPAWMVRFLMAAFGWVLVLAGGNVAESY